MALQDALKDFVSSKAPSYDKASTEIEYFIGVEGSFGAHHITPRGLASSFIGNLVCVDGIVTKCMLFKLGQVSQIVLQVHWFAQK